MRSIIRNLTCGDIEVLYYLDTIDIIYKVLQYQDIKDIEYSNTDNVRLL